MQDSSEPAAPRQSSALEKGASGKASMKSPFVSVIIPTLNREDPLRHVLRYFTESESYFPFEVIVVDQSETHEPATIEYLRSIEDKVHLVQIEKKGAGNARNYGARMAQGSILLFVDDDDLPQAHFIRGHVDAHHDPGVAAVCGAVLRSGRRLRTKEELSSEELDTILRRKDGPRDVAFSFDCIWGPTSNLSVKAEWFWKVGGFYTKEHAGVASGGLHDALFGRDLTIHGGRLRFSPLPAIVIGHAQKGGGRDLTDSDRRGVLEMANALQFWALTRNSRLVAIRITFRQMVLRRSIAKTAVNLGRFVRALIKWRRGERGE